MSPASDTPGEPAEPAVLPEALRAAVETLAARRPVLVCLDFDGCVAELADDPAAVAPVPANAAAVERLAALDDVVVAYVSGRPLEQLRALAAPPAGVLLVGSHGAEQDLGTDAAPLRLTAAQRRTREQILELLEELASRVDGALVERKPAGAALHVRTVADAAAAESLLAEAREAAAAVDGAQPKDGKMVVEVPVVHATKGEAIGTLRERTGAAAVFFAGDDVTDEQGFAVLGDDDVGVKVGAGETLAGHRIAAPHHLAGVLAALAAQVAQVPQAEDRAADASPRSTPTRPGAAPDA